MGKAFGDVQQASIGSRERDPFPFSVRGRTPPHVDNDVVNFPLRAADNLHLSLRLQLVMHAAERSFEAIEGDAALSEISVEPLISKRLLAEDARKKTSLIFDRNRLN